MEKITFTFEGEDQAVEFFVLEQTKLGGVTYILVTDSEEDDAESIVVVGSCCPVKSAYTLNSGTIKMIPATIAHTNMMERIFFIPRYIFIFLTLYFLLLHAFFLLKFICLYFITATTSKTHLGARCKYMARMVIFLLI